MSGNAAPSRTGGEATPKGFHAGTHRLVPPEATVARVRGLLPLMGITRVANVTGLDTIGIPVVMVIRPNARSLSVSQGKGGELAAARASGLMEAKMERKMHGLRIWGLALSILSGSAHADSSLPNATPGQATFPNNDSSRVEAFTGWLTNAPDFTATSSSLHLKLKYANVRQNSAPDVFDFQADGSLKILKDGVVSLSASYDAIPTNGSRYVEMMILVNGATVAQSLGADTGDWTQVATHVNWKVEPNDTFVFLAMPSRIARMDNGAWSVLTVKWTSR